MNIRLLGTCWLIVTGLSFAACGGDDDADGGGSGGGVSFNGSGAQTSSGGAGSGGARTGNGGAFFDASFLDEVPCGSTSCLTATAPIPILNIELPRGCCADASRGICGLEDPDTSACIPPPEHDERCGDPLVVDNVDLTIPLCCQESTGICGFALFDQCLVTGFPNSPRCIAEDSGSPTPDSGSPTPDSGTTMSDATAPEASVDAPTPSDAGGD